MSWDSHNGKMPPRARPGYEVGYAKPPADSRFKPGQSGNPGGRPKGAKNKRHVSPVEPLKDIIRQEAYRVIKIHDGNRDVSMPMAQAVMRSLAVKAAKGDHRSQRLFGELLSSVERQDRAQRDEWLETVIEYKLGWENELERRKRLDIKAPDPVPHPDDIHIDFGNNTIEINGPFTREEKEHIDTIREIKSQIEDRLEQMNIELAAQESRAGRAEMEDKIKGLEGVVVRLNKELWPG